MKSCFQFIVLHLYVEPIFFISLFMLNLTYRSVYGNHEQLLIVKLIISGTPLSQNIGALKGLSNNIVAYTEAPYNEFYK